MIDKTENTSQPLRPSDAKSDNTAFLLEIFICLFDCLESLKSYEDFQADVVTKFTDLNLRCALAKGDCSKKTNEEIKRIDEIQEWTYKWITMLSKRHFRDDEASKKVLDSIKSLDFAAEYL